MSMKNSTAPRAVYRRNNIVHVLFAGLTFGPAAEQQSAIKPGAIPVKIVLNPAAEGGQPTVTVTQRAPKKKGVTETWGLVEVPSHPRAAKPPQAS